MQLASPPSGRNHSPPYSLFKNLSFLLNKLLLATRYIISSATLNRNKSLFLACFFAPKELFRQSELHSHLLKLSRTTKTYRAKYPDKSRLSAFQLIRWQVKWIGELVKLWFFSGGTYYAYDDV